MNAIHKQRMFALELANDVRIGNAQLKMSIAAGSIDPITILSERSEPIKVYDVLRSINGFGEVRVNKIMAAARVPKSMRVDRLCGVRQVELVAETMRALEQLEKGRRKTRAAA